MHILENNLMSGFLQDEILTERTGQKFASTRQVEETKLHYLSLCEIPVFQFNAILMQLFPLTIDRPTKHVDAFVSEHTCRFL